MFRNERPFWWTPTETVGYAVLDEFTNIEKRG